MKARLALIVLACCVSGQLTGAEGTSSIVLLRGSYRSTAAVAKDYRTGTYVRTSAVDEGERPEVTIRRVEFPYPKAEPVYGPPMVTPPAVELGKFVPSNNWPLFLAVPVCVPNRAPRDISLSGTILPGRSGGMIIGGPLGGTILPGERGGMIIGGPLGGTILPGREGGIIIGGPLSGTILPGSR